MKSAQRRDAFNVLDELRFKVEKITQIHTFEIQSYIRNFSFSGSSQYSRYYIHIYSFSTKALGKWKEIVGHGRWVVWFLLICR